MNNERLEAYCAKLYGYSKRPEIDPASIPCIETSDSAHLCQHPLVSVLLVTYNHEPYIRECIESVLAQQTDFEFELVIGEDCSTDKTREICFEYQKRYPEKVRVLWANENVYKKGGNQARTQYHCRGEYIALLEGDDYWTDPRKLQKQIDLIRKTNAIGCVANYRTKHLDGTLSPCNYHCDDILTQNDLFHYYPHTSTYIFRADTLREVWHRYPNILGHYDVVEMHCMVEMGPIAHLDDIVSVYRLTGSGIATSLSYEKKALLEIKQYLDIYLHGPESIHCRLGAVILAKVADCITKIDSPTYDLKWLFRVIYFRQPFDLRSIRAVLVYFNLWR